MKQNNNMKKNKKRKTKTIYLKHESRRMTFVLIITLVLFTCIVLRILYLNIYMGKFYNMKLNNTKDTYVYGESTPRGRILDRNGKVLVDNKWIKAIYYKKPKNTSSTDLAKTAYDVSKILSIDYNKLSSRNLKEFYIVTHEKETSELITSSEYKDVENRKLTPDDIYELKIKRIPKSLIKSLSKKDKKAAYIYYLMNKGYSYDEKIIKNKNVTDEEYAYFLVNNKYKGFFSKLEWERTYPYKDTLEVILGSVSNIPKEDRDYYLEKGYVLTDRVGVSGLEKQYEELLRGEKDLYKLDSNNERILVKKGHKGTDIKLSIDIKLQQKIDNMLKYEMIKTKREANTEYFNRSYVVISDPNTGEILSISGKKITLKNGSYKVYDNSEGAFLSTITPGSVVKGASIMVGYNTGVLKIGEHMTDSCIGLYNLPEKCSWRTLGYINDIDALALSSNVYQYKIAMRVGGFNYAYGKRLKIDPKAFDIYRNMFYRFGLGVKTGLDYPIEEDGYKSNNRAGDLLINFAIGQYDTYTTLQLSQYISTLANGGTRYKTRFLKEVLDDNGKTLYKIKPTVLNTLDVKKAYINRVRKGLHAVTTYGTGASYMTSAPNPSGKTGTSESFIDLDGDGTIDAPSISNNFVGYAPSKKPVMSIAASFPDIQNPKTNYKSDVNQRVVSKSTKIFFDLYKKNNKR